MWAFQRGTPTCRRRSATAPTYVVNETGVVYCLNVRDGGWWAGTLPNDFYSASPTLADGKILRDRQTNGVTTVYRTGPKFQILASVAQTTCPQFCLIRSRCRRTVVPQDCRY
jgi:hypothetical protein